MIRATLDLIAEVGFASTTIDAIAERAGIGRATIYRRWSSKEDLFVDAIDQLTSASGMAIIADQSREMGTRDWLLAQARASMRSLSEPIVKNVLPPLLGELPRNPRLAKAWEERVVRPRQAALRQRLLAAIEDGTLKSTADPDLLADLLVAPFFFHVVSPFGHPPVTDSYPEKLVDVIWTGLAPT